MLKEIVIATGNANKVKEFKAILAPYGITVHSAKELGGMPEVIEDGSTFLENAAKKAIAGAQAFHKLVLADDSGLEVHALHGAPGIYSARYAGEDGNNKKNRLKLLEAMKDIEDRTARFVCALVLASPEGEILSSAEGEIQGTITTKIHPPETFGYDPLFIPKGFQETFSELPPIVKNGISHRGNAALNALHQGMFSDGLFFTWKELQEITHGHWLIQPETSPISGINAVLDDSRICTPGSLFVAISGDLTNGHSYLKNAVLHGARAICVEETPNAETMAFLQSEHCPCIQVPDSLTAFQKLAMAHRTKFPDLQLLAITGSCGKTSVKEMCAAILDQHWPGQVLKTLGNTNNHYGVPRNLLRITPATSVAVIELGSNHPGEIASLSELVLPQIGVVCNIGHAHLEFFHDLRGVAEEKGQLLTAIQNRGTAIFPADAAGRDILEEKAVGHPHITFGKNSNADICGEYLGETAEGLPQIRLTWKNPKFYIEFTWNIPGEHQAINAAAAAAVGTAMGIEPEEIIRGLQQCKLPDQRMQIIEHNGITWANDAYNANPDSMAAALSWFHTISKNAPKRLLILGEMRELGEKSPALHQAILEKAKKLFPHDRILTVGREMTQAAKNLQLENYPDIITVRKILHNNLITGEFILLKGSNGVKLFKLLE
ncbi:MAG: RdgB/HAM1 family non-canonical purine NTP pyrophosphatase [Lentisphaeria bacterium]